MEEMSIGGMVEILNREFHLTVNNAILVKYEINFTTFERIIVTRSLLDLYIIGYTFCKRTRYNKKQIKIKETTICIVYYYYTIIYILFAEYFITHIYKTYYIESIFNMIHVYC